MKDVVDIMGEAMSKDKNDPLHFKLESLTENESYIL